MGEIFYGEVLMRGDEVLIEAGDSKERVLARLGEPHRVRADCWGYFEEIEPYFSALGILQKIVVERAFYQDYYFIECDGSSHSVDWPNYLGSIGKSALGERTLILSPLPSTYEVFRTPQTFERVELNSGSISLGQDQPSVLGIVEKAEIEKADTNHLKCHFAGFSLDLRFKNGHLNGLIDR